jgi:Zn-dependent protease with chaperone function
MPSTKSSRTATDLTSESLPSFFVLRVLMAGYYPFLVFIVFDSVVAIAGLAGLAYRFPRIAVHLALPLMLLVLTLAHLLLAFRVLFMKLRDFHDPMELRVSREMAPKLYAWVEAIATERDLPAPDEIRVSADTVAHVYERVNGRSVLVLGAMAVRALPQPALAGVVAHELAHIEAGDTALGRQAWRCHLIMQQLEDAFHLESGFRLGRPRGDWEQVRYDLEAKAAVCNPGIWAVRLYHIIYSVAHAAHSRVCEFAADREEVKQAGAETAAQALILLTVGEQMPWTRLSSMAEGWALRGDQPALLFDEQARAVRSIGPDQWQDAIRKELKRATGAFDSHPGLRDRLEALGVSPKRALRLTPELSGPPSHLLFERSWSKLEKELAHRLLAPYHEANLAKIGARELFTAFGRGEQF